MAVEEKMAHLVRGINGNVDSLRFLYNSIEEEYDMENADQEDKLWQVYKIVKIFVDTYDAMKIGPDEVYDFLTES